MKKFALSLLFLFCSLDFLFPQQPNSLVNFRHLEHLTEKIAFAGDTVSIVHIYSNYPDYHWVEAEDSGPEGVACVDDAARAAVVYLRHYELTGNLTSLIKAKSFLKFVLKMQAEDGEFYNFIFADHSINRDGKTSYKSFAWWAVRGVWSLCLGYRVFRQVDSGFASGLKSAIDRSLLHVSSLLQEYGEVQTVGKYRVPQWLPFKSGADVTSELEVGLVEYYVATGDQKVRGFIEKLSEGLMMMQDGDETSFPFGLHRSWQTTWHMWGNGQTQALAYAGKVFNDSAMVQSAEREARGFYSRLLIDGFMKEMDLAQPERRVEYEQIAYGLRPMIIGLIRLYEVTGRTEYLKMAGLAGSWFLGNNVLHEQIYDRSNGRCFDGIRDSLTLNKNSGAESTIEALYSVVELERYAQARKYLTYRKVKKQSSPKRLSAVFKDDRGGELTLAIDLTKGSLLLLDGNESEKILKKFKD